LPTKKITLINIDYDSLFCLVDDFAKDLSHGIKNLYLPAAQRNETGNAK